MKQDAVLPADLARSVIAAPPLPRAPNGAISAAEMRRLINWLTSGGITACLFGGNANLYNMAVSEFGTLLDIVEAASPGEIWSIPSIGADFGKAADQIERLRERDFPTAVLLPLAFPTTPTGVATGLRRLADRYERPLIAYIRGEFYLAPRDIASLFDDGAICAVKYSIHRANPADDPTLDRILDAVGTAERIVSGMGVRPCIEHWSEFGIHGFTSGSACIAPHLATRLLAALKAGNLAEAERLRLFFRPIEDLRDAYSPIRLLHEAVRLADIAETGPISPFLDNLDDAATLDMVGVAARTLKDANRRLAGL